MNWAWIETTLTAVGMVLLSALGIYLSLILLTRIAGLRSFSKISSFDFAITIAIGSVIASTVMTRNPPLVQGAIALVALYAAQLSVAVLRQHSQIVRSVVDNKAVLLMAGQEIIEENLRRARVTESDLRGKLREANVTDLRQVRAVVMETTGDVSVIHADPEAPALDPALLEDVIGSERLLDGGSSGRGGRGEREHGR